MAVVGSNGGAELGACSYESSLRYRGGVSFAAATPTCEPKPAYVRLPPPLTPTTVATKTKSNPIWAKPIGFGPRSAYRPFDVIFT